MGITSVINKNELQRFKRIDAEYYQPVFLQYYNKLKALGSVRLGDPKYSSKITDGIHSSIDYDENSGIRCLSAQSVKKGYFDISANKFISKKQHNENLKTNLSVGDVILSSVGTIGNCAVVTEDVLPANADRHVGIITTTNEINPYYLCAFLNSKYGRFQTERESTGNVQKNLFIDKMTELLVPLLSQQENIGEKMEKALHQISQSKKLLHDAEDSVLSHLDFKSIDTEFEHTRIVSLQEIKQSQRADAEYYQPKYEEVLDKLAKFNPVSLISIANPVTRTIKPKSEKMYRYIEISDVDISVGEVNFTERIGEDLPKNARIQLKGGELIVSRVRPTRGAIGIVPLVCGENGVCSKAFSVFEVKSPMRECLQMYLRSVLGKLQLERSTKGTSYPTISDEDVHNIQVPSLDEGILNSISELVREAFINRYNAKEMLTETELEVEKEIEKLFSYDVPLVNTLRDSS